MTKSGNEMEWNGRMVNKDDIKIQMKVTNLK
jgi:hypothetical protein